MTDRSQERIEDILWKIKERKQMKDIAHLRDVGPPKPVSKPQLWQPGQSGNPLGKPSGSRNAINTKFLKGLHQVFDRCGVDAIQRVADEDPSTFIRVIAALQPKEIQHTRALDEISDEQLEAAAVAVKAILAAKASVTEPQE